MPASSSGRPRARSATRTARSSSSSTASRCRPAWSQVASRHPRPEIFPQGRRPGAAEARRGERRPLLPVALGPRRGGARQRSPTASATSPSAIRARSSTASPAPGPIGAGRAAISTAEEDAAGLLRRAPLHAGDAEGGAELAAMVQHRPPLGLRHRRPEPGPLLRRLPHRPACTPRETRLRASAAACLLHPVGRRRPRQRGRHHGPLGARGAPVQVRLRHRHQLLARSAARARSCPAAASRPA